MHIPAITVYHLQDGRAVQTAGLDTPIEQQIETLAEAGRLNQSPVPGAIRGEVWTGDKIRFRTFFEPTAAPTAAPAAPSAAEARIAEARQLLNRLDQLEKEGLKPEDLLSDIKAEEAAAAEAIRKVAEEAAAAEAARKAAEEAAAAEAARKAAAEADTPPSQGVVKDSFTTAETTPTPSDTPATPRGRLRPGTGA